MDASLVGLIGALGGAVIGATATSIGLWMEQRHRHDPHRHRLFEEQLRASRTFVAGCVKFMAATAEIEVALEGEDDLTRKQFLLRQQQAFAFITDVSAEAFAFLPADVIACFDEFIGEALAHHQALLSLHEAGRRTDGLSQRLRDSFHDLCGEVRSELGVEALAGDFANLIRPLGE